MTQWFVKDLSKMTGVSVQTLHHYDRIGLLAPSLRLTNGYRVYSEKDLLTLQQIIALKFFGFELSQIKTLLAQESSVRSHFSSQARVLEQKATVLLEGVKTLRSIIDSIFKNGEALSDKAIAKAVKRIQERVAIPQWTPHDLRRTFATLMGEALHIDPVVVEKCLGNKMAKIMATYNRNEMLPQRQEALEKWSSFIKKLIAA